LIAVAADNPSSFVRQQLATTVAQLPAEAALYWLHRLAIEDHDPKVRAAALLTALEDHGDDTLIAQYPQLLLKVFADETDHFVLRTALYVAAQYQQPDRRLGVPGQPESSDRNTVRYDDSALATTYRDQILPAIRRLQATAADLPVRRWAAQAAERIWAQLDPAASRLLTTLRQHLAGLRPGRSRWISKRRLGGCDETLLGRVLSLLAQDDYGYDAQRSWWGYRVSRGPVFRFRLWRLLHELFTPAPDKRQAFSHTIGRVSEATIRAPSQILAELSETKVPGEPLFLAEEGGWRPYLPLPDDFMSAVHIGIGRPRPVRFFTSEGVTEVVPPTGLLKNSLAYLRLTLRFADYAQARNWRDGDGASSQAYLGQFTRLGFRLRFQAYGDRPRQTDPKDESVWRFFPLIGGMALPLNQYLLDFADYFWSLFANSVPQLLAFLLVTTLVFLAQHFYANWTLRRARRAIGLSIGGWGTRGKSGTERLKAALFNALGCGLVSKSSGCEAMFMFAAPFGELRELLLYRPADKATIWEHRSVLTLASQLEANVFLWECMGLTPAYVEVLQQQWSRDDLSTITNAYPDHEDVQGPAGWNVAQVISGFVPQRTRLLTSEQQMLPLVRDACQRMGSSLSSVGWLESGLLTDDILKRFPYKEHPENVALVLALADELGCDRDYALKEMADRLVPDLGVLKTYPVASFRTRQLEFTNGMSANERFGCLGNWQRLGFDRQDVVAEPQTWISTVVNNRADRVPRSRVFAGMLVNDLAADRHFLIGSNLKGLQGFIWTAFERMLQNLSLWRDESEEADDALATWQRTARRFRQPTDGSHVRAALAAMLVGLPSCAEQLPGEYTPDELLAKWKDPEAVARELTRLGAEEWFVKSVVKHLSWSLAALSEYTTLADRIRTSEAGQRADIVRACHQTLRGWFGRKLVVIDNYDAGGDEIIETIGEETPPGFLNRIMGLQNIKGTGMDFVYRWQSWEKCYHACQLLEQTKPTLAERGLEMLAEFQDFGLLCHDQLRSTLSAVRSSPVAQRERFQATLDAVSTKAEQALGQMAHGATQTRLGGLAQRFVKLIEQFADVTDAVRRRKKADQIYRDLAHERISGERAILELRALNKRQEGGWLSSRLRTARLPLPLVPFASPRQLRRSENVESDVRPPPLAAQPTAAATPNAGPEHRR
jgi:poly-gamma-glutamate synthase PgsB/CapB